MIEESLTNKQDWLSITGDDTNPKENNCVFNGPVQRAVWTVVLPKGVAEVIFAYKIVCFWRVLSKYYKISSKQIVQGSSDRILGHRLQTI
ncbi:hypothetical protein Trydic_g2717 [Trypoxylus dichotomus]